MNLKKIKYENLNARQKENFNYQKIAGVLADYGITTMRLSDDWQSADFIAQDITGQFLKVQLKTRLTFSKKYVGKDLFICFRDANDWYLFPHDEVLTKILTETNVGNTNSWTKGHYSFPTLGKKLKEILLEYKIK